MITPCRATIEGVLEGVGQKFVYDESHRQRGVNRDRSIVHFLIEPNSVDRTGAHDGGGDLAQVMAEIDFVAGAIVRKRLIKQMQGLDATGKRLQVDLFASPLVARLEPYQRDDQLQIVLNAMLQFPQQDILVANLARIFLALRTRPVGYVDQRGDAIILGPILVLNETGEGLDDKGSWLLGPEGAEKLFSAFQHCRLKRDVRIVFALEPGQNRPALAGAILRVLTDESFE